MNTELKQHIEETLEKGMRFDGRKLDQYRETKIKLDVTKNAEGSATVMIGETQVIVGIKMAVDKPFSDTPEQGMIAVNVELLALSNPDFEPGPPGIQAVELARVVDRGIRESLAIDLKQLCITKGEKAWSVMIDICPINDAGNLFDASALGAIAALQNCRFPEYDGTQIDYKKRTDKKLPLSKQPVSVTVIKIGKHLIVDPTSEEEAVTDARLTVAATEDGKLCAMQKGGIQPLAIEDVMKMIEFGLEKTKELRLKIGGAK
ncbi:MAG: exosome complex protein Rrp42 [Candidatus Woesearchaeota archaeon]